MVNYQEKIMKLEQDVNTFNTQYEYYTELIHDILEKFERKGTNERPNSVGVYRLCFEHIGTVIFISNVITEFFCEVSESNPSGLSLHDMQLLDTAMVRTDDAIRYLIMTNKIDEFMNYLLDEVIPKFFRFEEIDNFSLL